MSLPITRQGARYVVSYVKQVTKDGDYTLPSDSTLRDMSTLLDGSMKRAYTYFAGTVDASTEMRREVRDFAREPRTCGGFKLDTAIMGDRTPFEQAEVVKTWVRARGAKVTKPHTYTFEAPGDKFVPVWVKKPRGGDVSLMTVMFGNTRGTLKAPDYKEWAQLDPNGTAQGVFINPLNCLEIVRQPQYASALVTKACHYEKRGGMGFDKRYEVYDDAAAKIFSRRASVELPKQSSKKTGRTKAQAAGYVYAELMQGRRTRNRNIMAPQNWEELFPDDGIFEGYEDDSHPMVTPIQMLKTLPAALRGNTDPMDKLSRQLFATRLTGSTIDEVNLGIAGELFPDADIPDID